MRRDARSIFATLRRALRLHCPVCGRAPVFAAPFRIRHHCPDCRALFQREPGFFVGAIMINVVTTEFAVLVAYLLCLLTLGGARQQLLLTALFAVGLLFPIAFYHHSWSLWLAADHLIESLPRADNLKSD